MRPTRIVLYGNFGAGNLGNEVTLQTAIEQTLSHLPHANVLCVCTDPEDVRRRHGIEAEPSQSRGSGWSWSDLDAGPAPGDGQSEQPRSFAPARGGFGAKVARLGRIAFRRVPRELA